MKRLLLFAALLLILLTSCSTTNLYGDATTLTPSILHANETLTLVVEDAIVWSKAYVSFNGSAWQELSLQGEEYRGAWLEEDGRTQIAMNSYAAQANTTNYILTFSCSTHNNEFFCPDDWTLNTFTLEAEVLVLGNSTPPLNLTNSTNSTNSTSFSYDPADVTRINTSSDMLINVRKIGNHEALLDEPFLDPRVDSTKPATSFYQAGWNHGDWMFPAEMIIDLGQEYFIEELYFFDGVGNAPFTVEIGEPFNWTPLFSDGQNSFNTWKNISVLQKTRYLQILTPADRISAQTMPGEFVLYGIPLGSSPLPPQPVTPTQPSFGDFVGTNVLVTSPLNSYRIDYNDSRLYCDRNMWDDRCDCYDANNVGNQTCIQQRSLLVGGMEVASIVREYHPWLFNEDEVNGKRVLRFQPSHPGWHFDYYYEELYKAGITAVPVIQTGGELFNRAPLDKVHDGPSLDPQSYHDLAAFQFQFAARYGATPVPQDLLTVDTQADQFGNYQQVHSGLGTLSYIETRNEPDKTWEGETAWYHPYEFAALSSAVYDGHEGKLGQGYGIKTADPEMNVVMGGLIDLGLGYVQAMMLWAEYHRDDARLPVDVLNFHHYSNSVGGQSGSASQRVAISPEEDALREKVAKLAAFRNTHLPDTELWITEFGYDTHPNSSQGVPLIQGMTPEEVQAAWIVRSFLALYAGGVDRAMQYFLPDNSDTSKLYSTSGLTDNYSYMPKVSYFAVAQMKQLLEHASFVEYTETPDTYIYQFKDGQDDIFVFWSPTADNTILKNYPYALPQRKSITPPTLTLFTPSLTTTTPKSMTPVFSNGVVVLPTITETPQYLRVRY